MDGTDQRHSPRRLLALSSGRQRCRCATEKRAEIPSPHDSPRAEDYFGYEKNITFLEENYAVPLYPPKADTAPHDRDVRYVPIADITAICREFLIPGMRSRR